MPMVLVLHRIQIYLKLIRAGTTPTVAHTATHSILASSKTDAGSAATLAINRSVDATPEVNLRNPLHAGDKSGFTLTLKPRVDVTRSVKHAFLTKIVSFSRTHNRQYWHYCQFCIPIYLQFFSLFTSTDVSQCEIR